MRNNRKIIIGLVILAAVVAAAWGLWTLGQRWLNSGALARHEVGGVDAGRLRKVPDFEKATAEVEALQKRYYDELAAAEKSKQYTPDQLVKMAKEDRKKLMQRQLQLMNPLNDRMAGAIAAVAKEQHMTVILDKHVAVSGVPDITDTVIAKFNANPGLKPPEAEDLEKMRSPIGYFDPVLIRQMSAFGKADDQFQAMYAQMKAEFQRKAQKLPAAAQQQLEARYSTALEQARAKLYAPLNAKVKQAVEVAAKSRGLSLVLDTKFVMFGGENITEDVVKHFLGR